MFSALAENHGNLQDKINLFVALCPITNLGRSDTDIFTKVNYGDLKSFIETTGLEVILDEK